MTIRNNTRIRTHLSVSIALLVGLTLVGQAQATKLYKWVDSKGNISYQDRPPPKNAKILEEREIEPPGETSPIDEVIPVTVYTVPECQRCVEVLAWLTARGLPTQELSLQEDRDAQAEILNLSNGLTAPTLFIDEQFVFDTSEDSMTNALEEAGYTLLIPESPDNTEIASSPESEIAVDAPDAIETSDDEAVIEPDGNAVPASTDDDEGSLFDENFNEIVPPEEEAEAETEDEDPDEEADDDSSDIIE